MQQLSDGNRTKFFAQLSNKLALLYFGAEWCGPCRALAPIIDKLDEDRHKLGPVELYLSPSRLEIVKVDIDRSPVLATDYLVRSVPTCLIVNGTGKVVGVPLVGAPPKPQFLTWLHKTLGKGAL